MAESSVKPRVTAAWSSNSCTVAQPLPSVPVAQAPDSTIIGWLSQ